MNIAALKMFHANKGTLTSLCIHTARSAPCENSLIQLASYTFLIHQLASAAGQSDLSPTWSRIPNAVRPIFIPGTFPDYT